MNRNRIAAVCLGLIGTLVAGIAFGADVFIEVVAKGRITGSSDPTNFLGYGTAGGADGARITLIYRCLVADVPPDVYGGARFPREADYFTDSSYGSVPNWMSSELRFDNRLVISSLDYVGNEKLTDQIKVLDRAGGASFDYFGVHDNVADTSPTGTVGRQLISGALIYEYVDKLVSGLDPDQRIRWRPNGDGSEVGVGSFRIFDAAALVDAQGTVVLESFQARTVQSGGGKKK